MRILDYNRVIKDMNNLSESEFMARVAENFMIEMADAAVKPARPGEFGLYLNGHWMKLTIRADLIPHDPVGRLDVSLSIRGGAEVILQEAEAAIGVRPTQA